MATVSDAKLKKEIDAILKKADLSTTTAKKVRQQLEDSLGVDLSSRRKEIDKMVMNYVNSQDENEEKDEEDEEEDDADESEEEDKAKKPAKRAAPPKKSSAKKPKKGSDEESASVESAGEDEYKPNKKVAPKKKSNKKKGSDSDSDTDWGKKKKKGGGKGKGTGYTREYKLSPELAELMGKESMPRHEVVKKMWAIIKERNLYDKSNKQFAICDDDLYKVIGTKRFRTFGMMKYLKTHFYD